MSILKKQNEELKTKVKKLEKERDAETKKKQRIESQFNQQKTTINELLRKVYDLELRLESENEKLENSEERCKVGISYDLPEQTIVYKQFFADSALERIFECIQVNFYLFKIFR